MNSPFSAFTRPKCLVSVLLIFTFFAARAQQPFTMTPVKGIVGLAAKQQASAWLNYKNTAGAFSLKVPGNVALNIKEVPNSAYPDFPPTKLYIYSVTDTVNMNGYIFRYNDFPNGMYLSDKKTTFAASIKDIENRGKVVKQPSVIFKDGIEGRALDIVADQFYMQVQIFVRGNRLYLLLKQNLKDATIANKDEFFDSFHFEAYEMSKGSPFELGNIEVNMPEKPLLIPEADNEDSFILNSKVYYGTNRNTGGLYGIEHGKVSKYYKNEDVDSLYIRALANLKTKNDSVYKIRDVRIANATGKEQLAIDKQSGNHKRTRIWISGDDFYFQSLNTTEDEISGPQAEHYFNAVVQKSASRFEIKASKIELLLKDLRSQDTTIHKQAMNAFKYYSFSKDELPSIYDAIRNSFPDDSVYNGARAQMMEAVAIIKDQQTVPAFKAIFEDEKNTDEIRGQALANIPESDKNGYDWYLNALIKTRLLKVSRPYRLFSALSDSLSYAAAHFDQILPMLNINDYRPELLGIASNMTWGKYKDQYKTLLKSSGAKLTAWAMADLDQFIKKSAQNKNAPTILLYHYLNILPAANLPKLTDDFTSKLLSADSILYLKNAAVVARIKTSLPVDKQLLTAQLDSLNMRYDILYALQEMGKLETIALKYRTPQEFAKLLLYTYIIDDYEVPQSINFLGSVADGKKTYHAFSVFYIEEGIKKEYLGIGGGVEEKPGKLDFNNGIGYSNMEPVEKNWTAQAKKLIAELNNVSE